MKKDYTGVCTDRQGDTPELRKNAFVHPGTFATTTRLLREFVFKKKIITLPFAIRSLTSLPASILGLSDRGRLVEGARADLVVFDAEELRDKATYFEPFQYSEGIEQVWVNGELVVDEGKPTEARPGQVLTRQRRALE